MTQPNEDPIQYRPLWHVAGWSGLNPIKLHILVETAEEARLAALRLYPQLEIAEFYNQGNVIDPERNRDILED